MLNFHCIFPENNYFRCDLPPSYWNIISYAPAWSDRHLKNEACWWGVFFLRVISAALGSLYSSTTNSKQHQHSTPFTASSFHNDACSLADIDLRDSAVLNTRFCSVLPTGMIQSTVRIMPSCINRNQSIKPCGAEPRKAWFDKSQKVSKFKICLSLCLLKVLEIKMPPCCLNLTISTMTLLYTCMSTVYSNSDYHGGW